MNRKLILLLIFIVIVSCEKEIEFQYNLDQLCEVNWGIPFVKDQRLDNYVDLSSPTIFHKDRSMEIADQVYDFWSIYDSKSILIQNMSELWIIYELNDTVLHVNKIKHPKGDFIAECIYEPE